MLLKTQERLSLVSPTLEFAISLSQLLLVPAMAVFAEVGILNAYLGASGIARNNWILIGCVLTLFSIHLAVLRLPTVRGGLESTVGRIKRKAVLSCPWMLTNRRKTEWRPGCWFIPEAFKQPLFRYDTQQSVIEQIVHHLAAEQEEGARFIYIEGESGQGKTRTVFLLIHALLKHPKLYELANRSFLYDMATGSASQSALCNRLDSMKHEDALVFVDNFHRVEPDVLKDITQKLLDTPTRNAERLVILLGQPSYAWRIRPTAEIRLLSAARAKSVYFSLGGVPSNFLVEQLDGQPGADIWTNAFGQTVAQTATVPQLHFAQAVAKNTNNQLTHVKELLELIEGVSDKDTRQVREDLVRFVAIVTALSLYKGNFTNGDFWRVCWAISRNRGWFGSRLIDCVRMRFLLGHMSRLGFTPKLSTPNTQFVFHEAMSEHCKDRLEDNPIFWSWFTATLEWRLSTIGKSEFVIRWLLSCELHENESMEQLFEAALLNGTLSPMVRSLDRNWKKIKCFSAIGYQYALLLDKVGRFSDSRKIYAGLDALSLKESVIADRTQIARVEVDHGKDSYAKLNQIVQRQDKANIIVAEYWKIHLEAHQGIFRPEELTSLAERLGQSFGKEDFEKSYFLMHNAARIFFDAHRHVYLVGNCVEEHLSRLRQLPLEATLRRHLPQFSALSILYRDAHLLAHEILPKLVFFGSHPQLGSLVGKMRDDAEVSPRLITKLAHESYSRARDEFAIYGDREYLYLQADVINQEMLLKILSEEQDFEPVRLKLIDYEAFIRKTGFADIASYPCFYFFRWHMLNYFRWLERGDHQIAKGETEMSLEAAQRYLKKSIQWDEASGNAYGLWRTNFLKALVDGLLEGNKEAMVESLMHCQTEAEKRGYWRDNQLVQVLLNNSKITPLDIKRTILFFPFVHQ